MEAVEMQMSLEVLNGNAGPSERKEGSKKDVSRLKKEKGGGT